MRRLLLWLLSIALALHLLSALAVFAVRPEAISTTPDPLDYRLAALNLLDYGVFSFVPPSFDAPQLLRPPAYPALLAVSYLLDGRTGLAIILFQSALLVLMGAVLFRLLGAFRVPDGIALALTAFYLFEPLQWLYTLHTMTETISSALVLGLVAGALAGKGIATLPRAALFGVGLSLLILAKPTAVLWAPFLLALVPLAEGPWRARVLRTLVALLFLFLALFPWMLRNHALTGHWIVSSSSAFNLVLFAGTPETVPPEYWDVVTTVSYNGHTNQVWYAYTTHAYGMLLETKDAILADVDYLALITRQFAYAPAVWFGFLDTKNEESTGHSYGLIASFALGPDEARDATLLALDLLLWGVLLVLTLLGAYRLIGSADTRFAALPLLIMLVATVLVNFQAAWVRMLLPLYPVILLCAGVGTGMLLARSGPCAPVPSLLRRFEHRALSGIVLSGHVLDLGGARGAEYLSHIKGSFDTFAVNLDVGAKPDLFHDLEKPLPLTNASYDHALLVNVLEHIYGYRDLIREAARVVKPGGSVVAVTPFLFPEHPDPKDYWRFTGEALREEFRRAGLADIRIEPLGSGVFAARYLFLERLMPRFLRALGARLMHLLVPFLDRGFAALSRLLGKRYAPADYALGYLAIARKP